MQQPREENLKDRVIYVKPGAYIQKLKIENLMHQFAGEQIYQNLRDAGCRKKATRVIMLLSTCKQRLVISLQTRSVARILLLGHVLIPVPGTICFLYRNAYPILNLEPLPLPVPEFGPVSVAVCAT